MASESTNSSRVAPFTEKGFYLSELRDRTIAIAVPAGLLRDGAALEPVLKDLEGNRTRVILVSDGAQALEPFAGSAPLSAGERATLPGRVWRRLGQNLRVGVVMDDRASFGAACSQIVLALGIRKLVWVDAAGGLLRADGERDSFIDAADLRDRIAQTKRGDPLGEILVHAEAMLSAGVAAVNLCKLDGIADELFIKLKPTLVNSLFAVILLGGLAFKRALLKPLFGSAFQLNDAGWRTLTLRWGLFFVFLAILNEVIWRSFSTDFWVAFKLFGMLPITVLFAGSQTPFILRQQPDGSSTEPVEGQTDPVANQK